MYKFLDRNANLYQKIFKVGDLCLRITWQNGILLENNNTKVIFDLQHNRFKDFPAFVSHGHFDHLAAFKNDNISKFSSKETFQIASSLVIM